MLRDLGIIEYCDQCRSRGAPDDVLPPWEPGEYRHSCGGFTQHRFDANGGAAFSARNRPARGYVPGVSKRQPRENYWPGYRPEIVAQRAAWRAREAAWRVRQAELLASHLAICERCRAIEAQAEIHEARV